MEKHRVLIIEEDSLFSNGVELLLVLQENLEIVGSVRADLQVVTAEIQATNPNVIIISDDIATSNAQLIMSLLRAYPDLRIITFSLEDNRINVYDKREVIVSTASDLITAITEEKLN